MLSEKNMKHKIGVNLIGCIVELLCNITYEKPYEFHDKKKIPVMCIDLRPQQDENNYHDYRLLRWKFTKL